MCNKILHINVWLLSAYHPLTVVTGDTCLMCVSHISIVPTHLIVKSARVYVCNVHPSGWCERRWCTDGACGPRNTFAIHKLHTHVLSVVMMRKHEITQLCSPLWSNVSDINTHTKPFYYNTADLFCFVLICICLYGKMCVIFRKFTEIAPTRN